MATSVNLIECNIISRSIDVTRWAVLQEYLNDPGLIQSFTVKQLRLFLEEDRKLTLGLGTMLKNVLREKGVIQQADVVLFQKQLKLVEEKLLKNIQTYIDIDRIKFFEQILSEMQNVSDTVLSGRDSPAYNSRENANTPRVFHMSPLEKRRSNTAMFKSMYVIATYFCCPQDLSLYDEAIDSLGDKCDSQGGDLYPSACYLFLQVYRTIEKFLINEGLDLINVKLSSAHKYFLNDMMSYGYPVPHN